MYRNKKDVDKHVQNLQNKLSPKEFTTQAFSVARLYFDVGDYANCQKYVEQYLTQKDNNAAAYKLLGLALQKLGQKDKALDHFKTSLDIDPTQTSTILDICELLADDGLAFEPGRAQYWCEKAEATFPRHPITFRLRERLVIMSNPDPQALVKLLTSELEARPKDASLHARLLKHYLNTNKITEAFEHSCNVEFSSENFINNYTWYEVLDELLKNSADKINPTAHWLHQLLLLTVRERLCVLSMTETPTGPSKSLVESNDLLHAYDQTLDIVAKAGAPSGFANFHASLLIHHRAQFAFHAATFMLKKAKKDQLSWRDANKVAAPLMLIAWQTVPLDLKVNWLKLTPEKMLVAVNRWNIEGSYRCSQSGHYLISNYQDKNKSFLDQVSQICSGPHWKDKVYNMIFSNIAKIKTSHFVSNDFSGPILRLPGTIEVEAFDDDALNQYGNSLHHFVWTLLNYKNLSHFKCSLFDTLTSTVTSCGPETLNKLDIYAFLYCAALTARQQKANEVSFVSSERPSTLPANITDLLCPLSQMKWWDCAYKYKIQKVIGPESTDIHTTLSRGIEVVRCIDNHGLDAELLCILGRIFSEKAKAIPSVDEKKLFEMRAVLYYQSAIPLLEKLKSKIMIRIYEKRMFDYTHTELWTRELNGLLEESKLYVASNHIKDCDFDKAIEILSKVKSVQAYHQLAQIYKKIAQEENYSNTDSNKSKNAALLARAKNYAYKALDLLKDTETKKNNPMYAKTQEIIEDLEIQMIKMDPDLSSVTYDAEGKSSSDENVSCRSESIRINNHMLRNVSSTPKGPSNSNVTNYRTAIDSQILEITRMDQLHLERIEHEIRSLQKKDTSISEFMSQLGDQIMSTINSNIQNTNDQFKLLKISVDECKNECKDVGELKKQIAELKKEVSKIKKSSSEQAIDHSELYNLDDENRSNDNSSNYAAAQLPFAPQMLSHFNQRPPFPMPPNPYQLYNQSLYNLYNQYSQFAQPSSVPGAPPLFDTSRGQMNYPGVYPTPDQMYLDVAHLIPPSVHAAPTVPAASTIPTVPVRPKMPAMPAATMAASAITTKTMTFSESKEVSRSLPVNVVITSSDPLPTCASTPAPVLSVTIPPKHIKGSPHNYQIAMPTSNEAEVVAPPVFSFSMPDKTQQPSSASNWKQAFQSFAPTEESALYKVPGDSSLNNSKTVVDAPFKRASPNTSLNKSRTLSEKSNTSIDNYDPCPDFKPIVPLPAEVKVTTGEEYEETIFSARAKLFRFVDKQWKERGIGKMKLLKHRVTGKVRVLMRREQVHKICANHIITSEMEIKPMNNETKAYFWVANDFAEETIVLEKFSIRFKTADIAKEFYNAFEKARQDSKTKASKIDSLNQSENTVKDKSGTQQFIQNQTNVLVKETVPVSLTQSKNVIGGFTFSSTPVFKPVENDTKSSEPTKTDMGTKSNVFSGLAFKSNTSSPFSNIFTAPAPPTTPALAEKENVKKNQLNTSDTVEEFEPNIDFKPVIPLPAIVDQKTGEEDEQVLFEHRAKLLCFDSNTKEWKERGLGNIKLLVNKQNNQKIRMLMRREQIMKVCCNHAVTKEMMFQKMPNLDKAVTWCAKDFSEGKLVPETFCLRFKTVKVCDDFIEVVKSAQSKLKDDTKATKEEQNAAKQINQTGFGDKFKLSPGSWNCESCYTNNPETFPNCVCCNQPKPQTSISNTSSKTTPSAASTWGDKFKPKAGSWECQSCLVRNEANLDNCFACNDPKDPKTTKSVASVAKENTVKFSFGITPQSTSSVLTQQKVEANGTGFGDKFKPKKGSWECKQCLVRNEGNVENCVACSSSKDPNAQKKSNSIFDTNASATKFNFGIPLTVSNDVKPNVQPASIFDGTGSHKFSFGIPSTTTSDQKPTGVIFATPTKPSETTGLLNFGLKKSEETPEPTATKPALLPTPQTDNKSFASKQNGQFGFVFKSTTSEKSPAKSPNKSQGDDSDGEECIKEEDCNAHFNPVIPMPDKIDVVTGEENEVELFSHRARLYRFVSGEWKERGTGIVKILKHNETKKLRVVMRQEQVLKICLNHALTNEITYEPKDEKSWLFAANDFSEGAISLEKLCLRFQNKDIALQFKEAVDCSLAGKSVSTTKSETKTEASDEDDVVFVSETQASADDRKKAQELMLPENFYTYKMKDPCKGRRGCIEDDEVKPKPSTDAIKAILSAPPVTSSPAVATTAANTPTKSIFSTFQSPIGSVYGTPVSADKTFDRSIFGTPLGLTESNINFSARTTNNNETTNFASNKENAFAKNAFNYSSGGQKTLFATPTNIPGTLFGDGDPQSAGNNKSSLLATPKLNAINTSSVIQTPDPKSIFASAAAAGPSFGAVGAPVNTSAFGNTSVSTIQPVNAFSFAKPKEDANTDVKTLFGATPKENLNTDVKSIFGAKLKESSNTDIKSIFGAKPKEDSNTEVKSIFGAKPKEVSNTDVKSIFGAKQKEDLNTEVKSIFGAKSKEDSNTQVKSIFGALPKEDSNTEVKSIFGAKPKEDSYTEVKSIFGTKSKENSNTDVKSIFGAKSKEDSNTEVKSIFGAKPKEVSNTDVKSIFGAKQKEDLNTEVKSIFGAKSKEDSNTQVKSIFGALPKEDSITEVKSIFGATPKEDSNTEVKSIFGTKSKENSNTDVKSIFGAKSKEDSNTEVKSIFGAKSKEDPNTEVKSIFGAKPKEDSNAEVKSLFGGNDPKPLSIFSGASQGSLFGPGSLGSQSTPASSFSFSQPSETSNEPFKSIFSGNTAKNASFFNTNSNTEQKRPEVSAFALSSAKKDTDQKPKEEKEPETKGPVFKIDDGLSFADLSTSGPGFAAQKKADFKWEGAGQPLFGGGQKKNESGASEEAGAGDEEYDPHYEPIVPLPEKIVVTTGEEDEEKVFGERCKLYRYDEKTHEWKERGVGEMKILYHPQRNTYRLLLRREQVHKAVLNMLVFMELELLPMKNSDRAWTWVGRNFAEVPSGEQETLAVRFKSIDLANSFRDQVQQCTRKLQAAAAKAIREEQEAKEKAFGGVAPLRLPKHLTEEDRADGQLAAATAAAAQAQPAPAPAVHPKPNGDADPDTSGEPAEPTEEEPDDNDEYQDEEDEYDPDYYHEYYEEEDKNTYYSCTGEAVVKHGSEQSTCLQAHIELRFDQDMCSPRIIVTDGESGAVLSDMLVYSETEFTMEGDSCSWAGLDFTTAEPLEKSVTVNFYDTSSAKAFYESCQTNKVAITYSSNG